MRKIILLSSLALILSCQSNKDQIPQEQKKDNQVYNSDLYDSLRDSGINIIFKNLTLENQDLTGYFTQEVLGLELLAINEDKFCPNCTNSHLLINRLYYLTSVHTDDYRETTHIKSILLGHLQKNRDQDLIKLVYEKNKKYFVNGIAKKYYQASGLKNVVKSLLYAYQDLEGTDISALYKETVENEVSYTVFQPYISLRVEQLLPKFKNKSLDQQHIDHEWDDVLWCYSFWTRRHAEGNFKVVFEILQDIDKSLSKP